MKHILRLGTYISAVHFMFRESHGFLQASGGIHTLPFLKFHKLGKPVGKKCVYINHKWQVCLSARSPLFEEYLKINYKPVCIKCKEKVKKCTINFKFPSGPCLRTHWLPSRSDHWHARCSASTLCASLWEKSENMLFLNPLPVQACDVIST